LLHEAYGHALLESHDNKDIDGAIQQLLEANRIEERTPSTWRFLASAWGRKAEVTKDPQFQGMATYALAEESVAEGHNFAAGQMAERAMKILPKGSAYWLRAQDIKLTTTPGEGEHSDKTDKKNR